MPLGLPDSDEEKRKIINAINEAWTRWEDGENLPEIIDDLETRPLPLALDYSPPDQRMVTRAINISFTGRDPGGIVLDPFGPPMPPLESFVQTNDRDDYRFLGQAGNVREALEHKSVISFFGGPILDLFGLSEDNARSIYQSVKPTVTMNQKWPPAFSLSSRPENWDIESYLGYYNPTKNAIVLYSRGIRRCAKSLNVRNMDIAAVVCLHEIGHWCVHHYPLLGHEDPWDTDAYINANTSIHETLAQLICRFSIVWQHDGHISTFRQRLLDTFDKLSQSQSRPYQRYKRIRRR